MHQTIKLLLAVLTAESEVVGNFRVGPFHKGIDIEDRELSQSFLFLLVVSIVLNRQLFVFCVLSLVMKNQEISLVVPRIGPLPEHFFNIFELKRWLQVLPSAIDLNLVLRNNLIRLLLNVLVILILSVEKIVDLLVEESFEEIFVNFVQSQCTPCFKHTFGYLRQVGRYQFWE